jgi:hypothetical protein
MDVSDAELRGLVREAVARQPGRQAAAGVHDAGYRAHASHGVLSLVRGAETGDACLIEPAVRCNHCGYCQSFGH